MLTNKPHGSESLPSSRYLSAITLCVFCIAMVLAILPRQVYAENPVTLAIAGPMVGTSFSVGIQYKVGVTAAIQSLSDGKLLGRPVILKTYDDSCSASIAEKVALDMMQEPPAVVIGHSCSMATIASAPVYASHHVLQITPASTNPGVTEMGIQTLFRMIGRDDVQGWRLNASPPCMPVKKSLFYLSPAVIPRA